MPLTLAILSLLVWLYLALARGTFWYLQAFDDDLAPHHPAAAWPSVIAIVPARNEAASIAQSLTSLLQQEYPGDFSIILVDDHSEDDTSQIAARTAQTLNAKSKSKLQILPAPPLPAGWTGKLWALHSGTAICGYARAATILPTPPAAGRIAADDPASPAYFWFTDADITHASDTLQRLVARAEENRFDLTSLMVQLQAKTFPERLLIPAFLFFFLKLYPPSWTADPKAKTAGAAGGCVLIRAAALQKIGGLSAIRGEVIDDCALARAVKVAQPLPDVRRHQTEPTPGPLWMGLTRQSVSLRSYTTFREIQDLIARTAYTQLRYNPFLLLGTIAAMSLIYLAPVALLFSHHTAARLLAAGTCLLIFALYLPTIRFYRLSPLWTVTLPAAALFYTYATALSAARYHAGRGAQWKGRSQSP